MMLGRELIEETRHAAEETLAAGRTRFRFKQVGRKGRIAPFDLDIAEGEVVGFAGLLGSGRTETAEVLFGARPADQGMVEIDGKETTISSPEAAIAHRFGFCPEDRKTDGIVADLSIRENIILALQAKRGMFRYLSQKRQRELADHYIAQLGIRTPDAEKPIGLLSGGNQQKALLARWLATEPQMLILDEPTRGIDIAAKMEIMALVTAQCERGLAILFISSEMAEVLRVSDDIAVLRDRSKIGQLAGADADEGAVYRMIAGGQA